MEQETPSPPSEYEPQEEPQKKTRKRRLWEWTRFGEKGLWDWLQLLIIPAVLAVGELLFNQAANERQQTAEDQRAQEVALQEYINGMENLLPDKDLRKSKESDEVRTLARARTLTILNRLGIGHDGTNEPTYVTMADLRERIEQNPPSYTSTDHRGNVLQFLIEEGLIDNKNPIVDLHDADLVGVDFGGFIRGFNKPSSLNNINLRGVNLSAASLSLVDMKNADLSNANLSEAILKGADLWSADLEGTDLSDADLSETKVNSSDPTWYLEHYAKSVKGATMPDGSKHD